MPRRKIEVSSEELGLLVSYHMYKDIIISVIREDDFSYEEYLKIQEIVKIFDKILVAFDEKASNEVIEDHINRFKELIEEEENIILKNISELCVLKLIEDQIIFEKKSLQEISILIDFAREIEANFSHNLPTEAIDFCIERAAIRRGETVPFANNLLKASVNANRLDVVEFLLEEGVTFPASFIEGKSEEISALLTKYIENSYIDDEAEVDSASSDSYQTTGTVFESDFEESDYKTLNSAMKLSMRRQIQGEGAREIWVENFTKYFGVDPSSEEAKSLTEIIPLDAETIERVIPSGPSSGRDVVTKFKFETGSMEGFAYHFSAGSGIGHEASISDKILFCCTKSGEIFLHLIKDGDLVTNKSGVMDYKTIRKFTEKYNQDFINSCDSTPIEGAEEPFTYVGGPTEYSHESGEDVADILATETKVIGEYKTEFVDLCLVSKYGSHSVG